MYFTYYYCEIHISVFILPVYFILNFVSKLHRSSLSLCGRTQWKQSSYGSVNASCLCTICCLSRHHYSSPPLSHLVLMSPKYNVKVTPADLVGLLKVCFPGWPGGLLSLGNCYLHICCCPRQQRTTLSIYFSLTPHLLGNFIWKNVLRTSGYPMDLKSKCGKSIPVHTNNLYWVYNQIINS